VLRIWLAPFQDVDGDLHDQRYVYVTVTPGQWTLESSRAEIKKRYQPVRMVGRSEAQSPTSSTAAEGTNGRPALPIGPPVPTQLGSPTPARSEDR
jgi:conjugal transfer pilus assembly protein TraV